MNRGIKYLPQRAQRTLTSYGVECLLRPQSVQDTENRCFFSVSLCVLCGFPTIPEDNKKSHKTSIPFALVL